MEIYSWTLETLTDRDIPTLLRGTGGGSFEYFSPKGVSAHNTYLRMLFEHGLLGLTAFMVGILSPLFHFIRRHGKTSTGIALFASLMGLLVHGLVIDTLHMRHLWLLLGLL